MDKACPVQVEGENYTGRGFRFPVKVYQKAFGLGHVQEREQISLGVDERNALERLFLVEPVDR